MTVRGVVTLHFNQLLKIWFLFHVINKLSENHFCQRNYLVLEKPYRLLRQDQIAVFVK